MKKSQVYLPKEELDALRRIAAKWERRVAESLSDAMRKVLLMPQTAGPVALWAGEPARCSVDHDKIHDDP